MNINNADSTKYFQHWKFPHKTACKNRTTESTTEERTLISFDKKFEDSVWQLNFKQLLMLPYSHAVVYIYAAARFVLLCCQNIMRATSWWDPVFKVTSESPYTYTIYALLEFEPGYYNEDHPCLCDGFYDCTIGVTSCSQWSTSEKN